MTVPRKGNNPFGPGGDLDAARREDQRRREEARADRIVRTCGAWALGIRCDSPIKTGEIVCERCSYAVASDLFTSGKGRRWMTEMLGHDLVTDAATAERLESDRRQAREARERAEQRTAARAEHGVVYYIRTGDNQIKIGTTARLDERIRELRCVNLRNLLAVEPGGFDLEHQRHEQFKAWRYRPRSEDFWDAVDLTDHIAAVVAEHGDPKGFLRTPTRGAT